MSAKRKIVLIGPVYPYKGGISHYTGLLCKALRQTDEVTMVSYSMQYPKLLYKKKQRDYSSNNFKIDDAEYWINTANVFSIVSAVRKINRIHPDMVVIQWWHPYFAPCYWILCKLLHRTKVLFVCHNVFPHERFPLDHFLTKKALRQGDFFITHSQADGRDLEKIKKNARYVVAVHPTYHAFRIRGLSREEARDFLHIEKDSPVLLFFGFVRPYKGLKYLLDAMPQIGREIPAVKLWIVGDFSSDKSCYLDQIQTLQIAEKIEIVDGYIPDGEVEPYFAATDLVVLPYETATQSGIVQIAYGFEKPVLATDVGGLPEVVLDGKTGYLVKSRNPEAIAEGVIRFFKEKKADEFSKNVAAEAERYSWDHMVEAIKKLGEEI